MTLNLEAIKARCSAASAGWEPDESGSCLIPGIVQRRDGDHKRKWFRVATFGHTDAKDDLRDIQRANRDLALHARTDLPALVAEVERLRKVEAAALAFIPAHDQATFDMKPVYGCAFAHGVQFVGKGYGEELDALRAALDAAQGGG